MSATASSQRRASVEEVGTGAGATRQMADGKRRQDDEVEQLVEAGAHIGVNNEQQQERIPSAKWIIDRCRPPLDSRTPSTASGSSTTAPDAWPSRLKRSWLGARQSEGVPTTPADEKACRCSDRPPLVSTSTVPRATATDAIDAAAKIATARHCR